MSSALQGPLAVVDLETTGGQPASDRITEIGVIEVEGFKVSSEWSTLVNPGAAIPAPIQALTGITHDMVAAAPSFAELAAGLYERLAGRLFVAHNARFDYGFLRREFERTGIRFHAKTLCTVRLSRRLYGAQASHSLDSLIARHGIACRARHRALPTPTRHGSSCASPRASTARKCSPSPRARWRAIPRCPRRSIAQPSTRSPKRPGCTSSTARRDAPFMSA